MKIYTKTGDQGTTSLIGGKRVPKNHRRIEAYGTVDELIAFIGAVRDHINNKKLIDDLIALQNNLMICAAILASDCDNCKTDIPKLSEEAIVWLEKSIDEMEVNLTPLSQFLLPGGHPAVSFTHIARTICRRTERCIISLSESATVPEILIRFFNRLSDYLFVLSRYIARELQIKEITWQPRLD